MQQAIERAAQSSKQRAGTILVTGAAGYLGGRVLAKLIAGGVNAVGLVRNGAQGVACDLLDAKQVRNTISSVGPTLVVHCAAAVPKGTSGYHDASAAADSVRMTENLLDGGVDKIVLTSSMTVYAPTQKMPVKESETAAQSSYAQGKLAAEKLLLDNCRVKAAVLRLPGLFGPPRRGGIVYGICQAIARAQKPNLPGEALMWAAMHVDDAADVIVRSVLAFPNRSMVANVGYPGPLSISLLVRCLADISGTKIEYDVPQPEFQMDLSVLASSFGLPQRDLRDRLDEMLDYARQ